MNYARARLWLGISGVGTAVVITAGMLLWGLPARWFPTTLSWSRADGSGLLGFLVGFLLVMMPFDLLGGFVLPRRFGKSTSSFRQFLGQWFVGVLWQTALFGFTAVAILTAGRRWGLLGALVVVTALMVCYVLLQARLAGRLTRSVERRPEPPLEAAWQQLADWGYGRLPTVVVDHTDQGFTGGIVGLPGRETIVLPRLWAESLSVPQMAVVLARRVEAVVSGQRTRGLCVALSWTLLGFAAAAVLPTAGVRSVAQLIATCCGFTCWTFLGLLVLPTISRRASFAIDRQVIRAGVTTEELDRTLVSLDRLQDDEPQRPGMVETIFHPVPSVHNRLALKAADEFGAWHVARMTLFLSWSCLGLLSRAVHCNAGRPELWVMLPTD